MSTDAADVPAAAGAEQPQRDGAPLRLVSPDEPVQSPESGWEPPVPLGQQRGLPAFPVEALPSWLGAMVDAVATATQTPPDLPGCLALAAVSAAAGGRAVARVRAGWDEPVNIYTVVTLPPASRKTPVFRSMTTPLQVAEKELIDRARPGIEQAKLERSTYEATAQRAEKAAAGKSSQDERDTAVSEALEASLTAQAVEVPPEPRLLADDITPEETAGQLAAQGGRLAVMSAEGGIFSILAGRYSGTPNLDVFLKGHGGDMLRIDRRGRGAETVDHPAITLGLTIQPAVLDDLSRTSLFRGTGLLARFLYALPDNTVGSRLADPPAVPEQVAATYTDTLRRLVLALHEWTDPAVMAFSPEANQVLIAMHTEVEPKLHPTRGEWAHIGDWAGKLVGHTARLAALLHIAEHAPEPWHHPVSGATAQAARQIADYYTSHALATFDRLGADPSLEGARTLLDWISRTGMAHFTQRDAHRAHRGTFAKPADLAPALALLEEHGHIQHEEVHRTGPGRKPSPRYWTHPVYRSPGQNGQI